MTLLTDSLSAYVADNLPRDASTQARVHAQRAYMAGCAEILLRIKAGQAPADLMREVVQYGRTVGTAVERAA